MDNKDLYKSVFTNSRVYIWVIIALNITVLFLDVTVGILMLGLLAFALYYNVRNNSLKKKSWKDYIENISSEIDSVSKHALLNTPIPMTIVQMNGTINWYNPEFLDMVEEDDVIGKDIKDIINYFDLDEIMTIDKRERYLTVNAKTYRLEYNVILEDDKTSRIVFYWFDETGYCNVKNIYNDEKPLVARIQVDNYDDVLKNTLEEHKPLVTAEIDTKLNQWASSINGLIKKYQKDKYLIIFEHKYLEDVETRKFSILDDIREIDVGNESPVTLSMGVGVNANNLVQLEEFAASALELALGRGGDQAVIKNLDNFEFYGGKTKAVEKRNKVKARIISHALRQLIDQSEKVYIMGHRNPDMDCFGAAIGVYRAVMNRNKEAHIVLSSVNAAIENVFKSFDNSEEYSFLKCDDAILNFTNKDLLVVVDTHRPSYTECRGLLEAAHNIVLIDHHRRGREFIDDTVLKYLEPYASSTCELVTEILQYMESKSKINIKKEEAEALLAGITVDTKNFTFKTGVRTFEAASILRRAGADTTIVRQLFQDDISTFLNKAEVVRNAKIIDKKVAISLFRGDMDNPQLVIAQGADELLNIKGISTSFVLGYKGENTVLISGRSLGDINVQIILEKLGGGGHLTVAGAQLKDVTLEEAENMLLESIEEYFKEGE